jgi:hypothetical protein
VFPESELGGTYIFVEEQYIFNVAST